MQKMETCNKLPYVQMQAEEMAVTVIKFRVVQVKMLANKLVHVWICVILSQ